MAAPMPRIPDDDIKKILTFAVLAAHRNQTEYYKIMNMGAAAW